LKRWQAWEGKTNRGALRRKIKKLRTEKRVGGKNTDR
jgi:hypothetical protein